MDTDKERKKEASSRARKKLKTAWNKEKMRRHAHKDKKMHLTQSSFAEKNKWTQGVVTQYLNGHTPLNLTALLKFCAEVRADPRSIYPELVNDVSLLGHEVDREIAGAIKDLSETEKQRLLSFIEMAFAH